MLFHSWPAQVSTFRVESPASPKRIVGTRLTPPLRHLSRVPTNIRAISSRAGRNGHATATSRRVAGGGAACELSVHQIVETSLDGVRCLAGAERGVAARRRASGLQRELALHKLGVQGRHFCGASWSGTVVGTVDAGWTFGREGSTQWNTDSWSSIHTRWSDRWSGPRPEPEGKSWW